MKLQLLLILMMAILVIGVFPISQNFISLIYGQESTNEYTSDLLGIKFQYPKELEENMKEETSNDLNNNHRSVTFDLTGDNALTIYTHTTDPEVKNLNGLLLEQLNVLTSTGSFAIKFFELNQNATLAGLPAVKILNDQSFLLGGNNPNLDTVMQIIALSEDNKETYGVTYRIDKLQFEEYLPIVEKIIDSIEIIH